MPYGEERTMFGEIESFAVRLFWLIVSVFIALILGNIVLGWLRARGGVVGQFAGSVQSAADPD